MSKFLRSVITKVIESNYARNILVLVSGTGLAQLIGILTSPITRRIYSPETYGLLAIVSSLVVILLPLATGKYELAIILPKEKKRSIYLCQLSVVTSLFMSVLLFIILLLFKNQFAIMLNSPKIANWLLFIPIILFGNAIYLILYNYNSKIKEYKSISKTQVTRALSGPIVTIPMGLFLGGSPMGLFLGQLVATWVGVGKLFVNIGLSLREFVRQISTDNILSVAKEFSKFPRFTLPAGLCNVLSTHFIGLFISVVFSLSALGQYSLSRMLLGIPLILVSSAVSQVYYQQLVATIQASGDVRKVFTRTFMSLFFISVILFGIAYFLISPLILFVYGSEWKLAGEISQILIPLFAVQFIVSPLSKTLQAFEKQEIGFLLQLTMLVVSIGIFLFAKHSNLELISILNIYVYSMIAVYGCFLFFNFFAIPKTKG